MPAAVLQPGDAPLIVLASASAARAAMLRAAGVDFAQHAVNVDEASLREALQAEDVTPGDAATALAELKGQRVAAQFDPRALVIASDQLLECDGAWLEKPGNVEGVRAQLMALRGKEHRLYSAAVVFRGGSRVWHHVDSARLWLRSFSPAFLDAYLAEAGEAVMHSVGAYHIEGPGLQLMAKVEGDHSTIRGMPLLPLLQCLRDQGALRA